MPRLGRTSPAEEVVPACLSPARWLSRGCRGAWGGDDGHTLAPGLLPSLLPAQAAAGALSAAFRQRKGGLDNARPLALKIHAKQLFPLGACSWMRFRSGSRGRRERERGRKRLGDLVP